MPLRAKTSADTSVLPEAADAGAHAEKGGDVSLPRYAAKRDHNEGPLATLAMALGVELVKTGPLDFWAGFRGRWTPLEIKNIDGKNRYTDSQIRFLARCKERQLPVWIWRTEDDVYRDLGARRAA